METLNTKLGRINRETQIQNERLTTLIERIQSGDITQTQLLRELNGFNSLNIKLTTKTSELLETGI